MGLGRFEPLEAGLFEALSGRRGSEGVQEAVQELRAGRVSADGVGLGGDGVGLGQGDNVKGVADLAGVGPVNNGGIEAPARIWLTRRSAVGV
jgi:hypothetical protein